MKQLYGKRQESLFSLAFQRVYFKSNNYEFKTLSQILFSHAMVTLPLIVLFLLK